MAEKKGLKKKAAKNRASQRPSSRRRDPVSQAVQVPESLSELPEQSNASAARQATVLQLQRQLGNNYVQRQIAQRAEDENKALSTKGLGLTKLLEGHPYSLVAQREDEAGEEEVKTPAADISLKLNKPQITKMSEKKVQEKHGLANIAGYTKPKIGVKVKKLKKYEITLVITLDFFMDLAKEYKGGRGQVLRDHEDAHILIAEKVANEFVIDPLKSELEAMPEFNDENKAEIQAKFAAKLADFDTEEGNASKDFDDLDYPRMEEAYYGVATSLADLTSGSPQVKAMAEAMDAFSDGAKAAAGDAETLGGLTQAIIDAQQALGDTNLARLQYNEEFKNKVAKAQKVVAGMSKKPDDMAEDVKARLDELSPALEKFTWKPEIE